MERDSTDFFTGDDAKFVTELKPSDFEGEATWKLKNHKCSIVLFYCAWCPHCQAVRGTWRDLAEKAAFFDVCAFNCEKHKGHVSKIKEDMPELIRGYPTILIYENGEVKESYTGDRTTGALISACMRSCSSGS